MNDYRDELRLTNYLLDRLETRLAGRGESVCMDKSPGDRYHVGVLMPRRRVSPATGCGQPHEDRGNGDPSSVPQITAVPKPDGTGDLYSVERQDPSAALEGSRTEAPSSHIEEGADTETHADNLLTRRGPPSALGMDFKVATHDSRFIDLLVDVRFAVYTRSFPTHEEQSELSGAAKPVKSRAAGRKSRKSVPIREKYIRHEIRVDTIRLRLPVNQLSAGQIRDRFREQIDQVLNTAAQERLVWRALEGRRTLPLSTLKSEETYTNYLEGLAGEPDLPPFSPLLDVRSRPTKDGGLRVSIFVVNATEPARTNAENAVRCLVDVQLGVEVESGRLEPVELVATARDYQYDRRVWAIGHATSVDTDQEQGVLRTRALARYRQPRLGIRRTPPATFEKLATQPRTTLGQILSAMRAHMEAWKLGLESGQLEKDLQLKEDETEFCQRDLENFRKEIERVQQGIEALDSDDRLLRAFKGMNRVFTRVGDRKGFDRWYLFQVCFIVSQLPSLAVREGDFESDSLQWADVLWFPTGGGKTEAYLGLIVCAALYDRLRGKGRGVTAWLRFPLRMLSVQQLHRAVGVLWEAEQERLQMKAISPDESDPISLGYFVGKTSTPNSLSDHPNNPWRLQRMATNPKLREKAQVVSDCPACQGEKTIHVEIDTDRHRIRHVCRECGVELPVYVSDEEIYRFLPTVIVGTVDKIATLAYQARFSVLWGGASWRCPEPEHGYSFGEYCPIYGCQASKPERIAVSLHDPTPAFHIQDELHLLKEELGAFAGHYETLARECEERVGGLPPKFLAATATIEGVDHQTRHLCGLPARRFPERGYDRWESFYAGLERDEGHAKVMRHYVAVRSHYMNSTETSLTCLQILHDEIRQLYGDPLAAIKRVGLQHINSAQELHELLNYYDTTLTYVGAKAAGTRVETVLDQDVGAKLPKAGSREMATRFLSGQSSMPEIHDAVVQLENPPPWDDLGRLDALVATSLVSHGVDVERFNLMVMDGMPSRTAEYIQASSRTGRKHCGVVVVVLSPWSARDQSIYHRFVEYHRNLERLVRPVPINRFAKFSVERTMPGVIGGLFMGYYAPEYETQKLKYRHMALKALDGKSPFLGERQITRDEMVAAIEGAYALNQGYYDQALESAMKEQIKQQCERQLRSLRVSDQRLIFNAFTRKPMFSLRDVDEPVYFNPDSARVGAEELRWLDRRATE